MCIIEMKKISPIIVLFRLFGICPILFEKCPIFYSILSGMIYTSILIFWVLFGVILNLANIRTILAIVENISIFFANIFYGATIIISKLNCKKYNQFINNVNTISYHHKIIFYTNLEAILYVITVLTSCIIWMEDFTILSIMISIHYLWVFCGIALPFIYVRYAVSMLFKLLDEIIFKLKTISINSQIKSYSFICAIKTLDTLDVYKNKFQKIFSPQITINITNAKIQICATCFIALKSNRTENIAMILFFVLPDILVICIVVASINQFGRKVNDFFH